jgi:hypothetical protein
LVQLVGADRLVDLFQVAGALFPLDILRSLLSGLNCQRRQQKNQAGPNETGRFEG